MDNKEPFFNIKIEYPVRFWLLTIYFIFLFFIMLPASFMNNEERAKVYPYLFEEQQNQARK